MLKMLGVLNLLFALCSVVGATLALVHLPETISHYAREPEDFIISVTIASLSAILLIACTLNSIVFLAPKLRMAPLLITTSIVNFIVLGLFSTLILILIYVSVNYPDNTSSGEFFTVLIVMVFILVSNAALRDLLKMK